MTQKSSTAPSTETRTLLKEAEIEPKYGITSAFLRKRRRLHLAPPYLKCGRSVYYRVADLEAWLEQCRVQPSTG
jgi:hypothetical protein